MENGQEESKTETVNNVAAEEVKTEKPVSTDEENAAKETTEEHSAELLQKIKEQVEFYFGNVNMPRDKFLMRQIKLDDGWIPMGVMLNFKMLASMSEDVDVILKALETSELIEISEDKKRIRRSLKHPLPVYDEEYRKAQKARTVYVTGFPLTNINIEKLKAFFIDYEPFETIIMRKYQDKNKKLQFRGSIFIQFTSLEDAKAFMARESVKYGDTELTRKWSNDYGLEKAKEKEERRQKKSEMKAKKNDTASAKAKDDESGEEEENEKDSSLPKGCVIHFSDVPDKCTREDIKERLGELKASIAFVDFKMGDKEGWVRLQGDNSAKTAVDKMKESKVLIHDKEVSCRVLEGEEEEKYLAKAKEERANSRQKYNKGKRGGKKGRHVQRGQRKRRNNDNDSFTAKRERQD